MGCSFRDLARDRSLCERWIILTIVSVSGIALVQGDHDQLNGPIRLWRNGMALPSHTSGRVQVLVEGLWGNICADDLFTITEANVVCHQLGYTGASSQSKQQTDGFGSDSLPILLNKVRCSTRDFLVILQCSYSTAISSSCTSNDDVSVTCFTQRIWDNPYNGQVRLTRGPTVNQGLVEVYCNGQWGTVCDDGFQQSAANTVCKQLGYSRASRYDHLPIRGNSMQPIWLTNVNCRYTRSCISRCRNCQSSSRRSCSHIEDITILCITSTEHRVGTTISTCMHTSSAVGGTNYGHIIEGTVTSAVVVFIIVLAVYSKDRRKRGLPFIPQKLKNWCSGRITQPSPASFDLQQHPYLRQVQSSPDSQFDTTYTQPCTSFSQFPETSFSQAPPPSYESQDSFPTKVDEDEPPPYEPPSGQPPAVFNTQNPTAHNVNV